MRTYSIELRERNYPVFTGKFNAYIAVYGQLSGEFLGLVEKPLKMDVAESEMPALLESAEAFIWDNKHCPYSKW
jgi:hypothetical protein